MSELHTIQAPEGVSLEFMSDGPEGFEQSRAAIAAAMAFGTAVFLSMATAPIVLGALVSAGRLTNATLGVTATLELLGITFGSTVGLGFLRSGGFGVKIAASSIALVALDLACIRAGSPASLCGLRLACGMLEGLILAASTLVLTYTRNPESMNGYFLGVTTLPQVAATYLLSSWAIPRFGENIGFWVLAAGALLGVIGGLGVSSRNLPARANRSGARRIWTPLEALTITAILIQYAAVGAAYNYLVQMAGQHQVSDQVVGISLALLQAVAMLGSFAVGWIGWRLAHIPTLVIGALAEAAVALALGGPRAPMVFLVASCLLGLCWNGLLPFSLKLLIQLDPTRRLALLNAPASLGGLAAGPFLVSFLVTEKDVTAAYWGAAGMFAVSAALYVSAGAAIRGRTPSP